MSTEGVGKEVTDSRCYKTKNACIISGQSFARENANNGNC